MKETTEINLNNLKCYIYSKNKDFSYIVSDKVFELGASDFSVFDEESHFLNTLNKGAVDCLILFFTTYNRESKKLIEEVFKVRDDIKLIVLSKNEKVKSDDFTSMTFDSFLKVNRAGIDSPYSPITIEESLDITTAPCDIYVRISNEKYLKLFKNGAALSLGEIDKYRNKSEKFLYIKKEDSLLFYKNTIDDLINKSSLGLSPNEFDYVSSIIKTLVPLSIALKIPQSVVINVVDSHVDIFRELNSLGDKGRKYVDKVEHPPKLTHMLLSCLLSSVIVNRLDWGSIAVLRKVIKCGAFHDISLKVFEKESSSVDESLDFPKYKLHPLRSAEMLDGMPFIDNDIITMIEQHHENGDGSGFPRSLNNSQISKMSCIFILSEFITKRLLSRKDWNLDLLLTVLDSIIAENREGNFKEAYAALKSEFD